MLFHQKLRSKPWRDQWNGGFKWFVRKRRFFFFSGSILGFALVAVRREAPDARFLHPGLPEAHALPSAPRPNFKENDAQVEEALGKRERFVSLQGFRPSGVGTSRCLLQALPRSPPLPGTTQNNQRPLCERTTQNLGDATLDFALTPGRGYFGHACCVSRVSWNLTWQFTSSLAITTCRFRVALKLSKRDTRLLASSHARPSLVKQRLARWQWSDATSHCAGSQRDLRQSLHDEVVLPVLPGPIPVSPHPQAVGHLRSGGRTAPHRHVLHDLKNAQR